MTVHVEHVVMTVFEFAPASHRDKFSGRVDVFIELAEIEGLDHFCVMRAVDDGKGELGCVSVFFWTRY
jgi:hypothetical protein